VSEPRKGRKKERKKGKGFSEEHRYRYTLYGILALKEKKRKAELGGSWKPRELR